MINTGLNILPNNGINNLIIKTDNLENNTATNKAHSERIKYLNSLFIIK